MKKLSAEQVIAVHKMMIEKTGGSGGTRDAGLLESALNSPFQTFDGRDVYPSLFHKAAALCRGIILNHPFVDGNKRTGVHAMLIFLEINGANLKYTQKDLIELGLGAAEGKLDSGDILCWLSEHSE